MYKFSRLPNALTAHLAWSSLIVGASLFIATPSMAETTSAKAPAANTAAPSTTAATTKATATPQASSRTTSNAHEAPAEATAATDAAETDPATASSEPTPAEREEARLAFEAGSKAFTEEQFDLAVSEFKKAYAIIPSPHAEYWIAVSMDKADPETKDPKALAAAYEIFLTNPGANHVGTEQVATSKVRLSELRKSLPATVTIVSTPEGASVTVNGEAKPGVTPLTLELPAGTHQVALNLAGHDTTNVSVNAEGGVELEQQVTLAPTVVAPPPAPVTDAQPQPQAKSMVPAIVTLGLGAAGLISGTVFGIMALNSKAKFKDDPTSDHADAAERNALIADMSFGIALTLGLTGVVLLTSSDNTSADTAKAKQRKGTELAVAPYASPFGGGAAARLKF